MRKEIGEGTTEDAEMLRQRDHAIVHISDLLKESRGPTPSKPTIFEVDDRLRKVNEKDYNPKIVSIGPIHHEKEKVKGMEVHKVRLLQELLDDRKDLSLEMLVEEVRIVEDKARGCYSRSSLFGKENFLEILLLDGCFIIQLMRNYVSEKSGDPILEPEMLIQIIHDLLLFENQLPFFVLDALFQKTKTGNPNDNLQDLILLLVDGIVPWFDDSEAKLLGRPAHLLELVYGFISTKRPSNPNSNGEEVICNPHKFFVNLVGQEWPNSSKRAKKSPTIHISSASDLKEVAGIRLRMSRDNILTFARGVLRFPPLQVSNETEALLRNLMAYEQLQLGDGQPRHVIDYVFFMHCLVKSTKDVETLRYNGIIKNFLGGDSMILEMIERLGANFMRSPDFTYSDVTESLNKYYSFRRHGCLGYMERTFFNTPRSLANVAAATLLLVLVSLQTYFTMRSFQKLKSN